MWRYLRFGQYTGFVEVESPMQGSTLQQALNKDR